MIAALMLAGCTRPPADHTPPPERFDAFVQSYFAPDHDRHDAPPFFWLTARADAERYEHARASLASLRTIDTAGLDADRIVDWMLLEASLRRTLRDSVLRTAERSPARYLAFGGIEWKLDPGRSADENVWRSVLLDLVNGPAALSIGRERLTDPPALWVDIARGTIRRNRAYLHGPFADRARSAAPPSMRDSLLHAAAEAESALGAFDAFLKDTVQATGEGSWAVGREYYDWLLREYHFLPYDVEGMVQKGWEEHRRTKEALERLASTSGTGKTWQQLVAEMKEIHPAPHTITDAYAREALRARSLIVSRNMIDIPPAETLIFVPTPPALRETYAWGGYGGITMRDSVMTGRFFVTDVDSAMTSEEVAQKLRTQNTGWITPIALHEGYPGHHLQAVYARRNPNTVRARLGSTYFGEGWALYCESWMGRNGFYVDRWDSLGWLNMRLWRTARVILDPSLHAGLMTYDDAVRFFVDEVGLERSAAEAEVNRYTTWATQAPSYIIGWLEIERLKALLERNVSGDFPEKQFVEMLLETGSLPPALLSRSLLARWASRNDQPVSFNSLAQ